MDDEVFKQCIFIKKNLNNLHAQPTPTNFANTSLISFIQFQWSWIKQLNLMTPSLGAYNGLTENHLHDSALLQHSCKYLFDFF